MGETGGVATTSGIDSHWGQEMADLVFLANRLNQTALNGTDGALVQLLRETPISPPHGQAGGLTIKKSVEALAGGKVKDAFGKVKLSGPLAMIAFIKFRPVTSNTDGQEGALTFDIKYAVELKTTASRNGWVPCWFLPWKSGLLVKLTIAADAGPIALDQVDGRNELQRVARQ